MLARAVADAPDDLERSYLRGGLDRDAGLRCDISFLMIAVCRSALHFGFRQRTRAHRAEDDYSAIILELEQSDLSRVIDLAAARSFLTWTCMTTKAGDPPPRFVNDDVSAKYISLAAASLVYIVGTRSNWRKRYRGLGRGTRHLT